MMPEFRSFVDELFQGDLMLPGFMPVTNFKNNVEVNISETETESVLEFSAPGLSKYDFKINLEEDLLTVSYNKKEEKTEETKNYKRREFHQVSFKRSFNVPESEFNYEDISANYTDGILKLSLPKKKELKVNTKKEISIS